MSKPDLRTAKGRRQEIIQQIKDNGGWSVFWITGNHLRASVATFMNKNKEITVTPKHYPWSDVKINRKARKP